MSDFWKSYEKGKCQPLHLGWYATLHSWDSQEGSFPGAHFWTGSKWGESNNDIRGNPVVYFNETQFFNPDDALAAAYDNDPDL